MSAPLSAPESVIDALMTRNLLAAALSPVAALPAPGVETAVATTAAGGSNACPALLRHTFNRLQTGESQTLCQFQGKVLVVVNTASYCGYTKQYEGLEAMYRKYKDRGLVVVGFPSNDFGNQEPGSNKDIAEFCRTTYGVQFPMFEKSSVTRLDSNPLYRRARAEDRRRAEVELPQVRRRPHRLAHHELRERRDTRCAHSGEPDRKALVRAAARTEGLKRRLPRAVGPSRGLRYNFRLYGELAQLVRAEES